MKTKHIFLGGQRACSKVTNQLGSLIGLYWYHPDHIGSTSVITDVRGRMVQNNLNSPYGTAFSEPTVKNPYLFTGKELDSTGLYYYGARYYDPVVGRFITADNFIAKPYNPQYLNRYSYCMNNPLRYIDPTGNTASEYGYSWEDPFKYISWGFSSFSWSFGGFGNLGKYAFGGLDSLGRYAFDSLDNLTYNSSTIAFNAIDHLPTPLINGVSNPITQSSISILNTGIGNYFGDWAKTVEEYAPKWTSGISRAIAFQSAFQGLGILQSTFGGKHGYYSIYNQFMASDMQPLQAYLEIGIHSLGVMAKAAVTTAATSWGASWGGTLGAYGSAAVIGVGFSMIIDWAEQWFFNLF